MNKHLKHGAALIIVFISLFISSCCKTETITIDSNELQKIFNFTVKTTNKLNSNVDLYVDYSTCVKEAVDNSVFFRSLRPRITGANPTLYAIKGNTIQKISSDKNVVNQELNNIVEVSYADLKGTVEKICNNNNQAILITDGEYWTTPEGERIDLPYMKDAFIKWLNKGFVIHIISEPYVERLNGRNFDKLRFYFFFTDDKIENNIFKEIAKAENFNNPNVSFFKMTNSDVRIKRDLKVNQNLTSTVDTSNVYDYIEILDDWKTIFDFVANATNDQGELIPGGEPLIDNIKLKSMNLNNYKIQELGLNIFNITDSYLDSIHNQALNVEIKDAFKMVNSKGVLSIKINNNIQSYLNNCKENLIRIDIVLKDIRNIDIQSNIFSWVSLTKNSYKNISINESVKQALDNPDSNPINRNNGIIHSIFVKTNAYKN